MRAVVCPRRPVCPLVHGAGRCCETAQCLLAETGTHSPGAFGEAEQAKRDPAPATVSTTSHGVEIDWP